MTLLLAHDFIPYPGETQYVAHLKANYGHLFPKLVDQSQFNRRGRNLQHLIEALRQHWVAALGGYTCDCLLLDTQPVPVLGYKRSKPAATSPDVRPMGTVPHATCAILALNSSC